VVQVCGSWFRQQQRASKGRQGVRAFGGGPGAAHHQCKGYELRNDSFGLRLCVALTLCVCVCVRPCVCVRVRVSARPPLSHSPTAPTHRTPHSGTNGDLETAQWLVEAGANPAQRSDYNNTTLHYAANYGQSEVVQWLAPLMNINELCSPGHGARFLSLTLG
jgi:hypothetical protein